MYLNKCLVPGFAVFKLFLTNSRVFPNTALDAFTRDKPAEFLKDGGKKLFQCSHEKRFLLLCAHKKRIRHKQSDKTSNFKL